MQDSRDTPRLLRLDEVIARVSIKKPTIYRAIKDGKFPAPCKLLGRRSSAWSEAEINEWIEARLASRGAMTAPNETAPETAVATPGSSAPDRPYKRPANAKTRAAGRGAI